MHSFAATPTSPIVDAHALQAASALALVVQHNHAASQDLRLLCSLLQTSNSLRTRLQHAKACGFLILQGPARKFFDAAAWVSQHANLIQEVHVLLHTGKPAYQDQQLAAAIAQLSGLRSLELTASCAFDSSVLASMAFHSQLTRVNIDMMADSALSCLPTCVRELEVVVDASALLNSAAATWEPQLTLAHLSELKLLHLTLCTSPSAIIEDGAAVKLPTNLHELHLGGPIEAVSTSADFSNLEVFSTARDMIPLDQIGALILRMPTLRSLCIDGLSPNTEDSASSAALERQVWPNEARALARALGACTQLTCLVFEGFDLDPTEPVYGQGPARWGNHIQHLTGLKTLSLALLLEDVDVFGLAKLTGLTSLSLATCGPGVNDESVTALCEQLIDLQELSIKESSMCECSERFPVFAQLTSLTLLDLDRNWDMYCEPEDLQLLTPLVNPAQLTLPPSSEENFLEEDYMHFMTGMPALRFVRALGEVYHNPKLTTGRVVGLSLGEYANISWAL